MKRDAPVICSPVPLECIKRLSAHVPTSTTSNDTAQYALPSGTPNAVEKNEVLGFCVCSVTVLC